MSEVEEVTAARKVVCYEPSHGENRPIEGEEAAARKRPVRRRQAGDAAGGAQRPRGDIRKECKPGAGGIEIGVAVFGGRPGLRLNCPGGGRTVGPIRLRPRRV